MKILKIGIILLCAFNFGSALKGNCSIDAAFTWFNNGRLYLLKGDKYARWDDSNDRLEYVSSTEKSWPGMPFNVDAAITFYSSSFVFKGCSYWKTRYSDKFYGPYSISEWNLPCNIDAAATWGKYVFFFKGDFYYKRLYNTPLKPGGKYSITGRWRGLPSNIDVGFQWKIGGKTYFFKGDKYWRYEKSGWGKQRNTWKGFRGLGDSILLPDCPCDCEWCCDRNWRFDDIIYDLQKLKPHLSKPEVVVKKCNDNRNHIYTPGSIDFTYTKSVTESVSFIQTKGAEIKHELNFEVGIPKIASVSGSISISTSRSMSYGKTNTVDVSKSSSFKCPGYPGKLTICQVSIRSTKIKVPYTAYWRHESKGCKCTSQGVYEGVSYSQLELKVEYKD